MSPRCTLAQVRVVLLVSLGVLAAARPATSAPQRSPKGAAPPATDAAPRAPGPRLAGERLAAQQADGPAASPSPGGPGPAASPPPGGSGPAASPSPGGPGPAASPSPGAEPAESAGPDPAPLDAASAGEDSPEPEFAVAQGAPATSPTQDAASEADRAASSMRVAFNHGEELALELDSNVARVAGDMAEGAGELEPVLRLGARGSVSSTWDGDHHLVVAGSAGLRVAPSSSVLNEDLVQSGLDAQWSRPTRDGALRAGARLTFRDVASLHGVDGDRTYRTGGGDLLLVLFGERARAVVTAGPRVFQYKLDDDVSWYGGGGSIRMQTPLGAAHAELGDAAPRYELGAALSAEQRSFFGKASTNICAPGERGNCIAETPRRRSELMGRAGATLTYTGGVIATVELGATVLDSNSYGQSWQGLRVRAAVTAATAVGYLSLTGTVNAERYPEGLIVPQEDLGSYLTLDADNRSSLEVRLARRLGGSSELELRAVAWRDLFHDTSYQRVLLSVGVVWGR